MPNETPRYLSRILSICLPHLPVLRDLWQTAAMRCVFTWYVVASWISYTRLPLGTSNRSCSGVNDRTAHSSYGGDSNCRSVLSMSWTTRSGARSTGTSVAYYPGETRGMDDVPALSIESQYIGQWSKDPTPQLQ